MKIFEGSYATVIMIKDISNKLFVMKKDSPLVIGIGENEIVATGFTPRTKRVLENSYT